MRRLLMLSAAHSTTAADLPAQGEDKDAVAADEKALKDAYQKTDGKSLVAFLSTRAKGEVEPKRLNELIGELSAKDATARDRACQQLIAIGAPAVPKLRQIARTDRDRDAGTMARKLLKILDVGAGVSGAAIRLLALRPAPGMVEAMLAYLPLAENDAMLEEIKAALAAAAHPEGKPHPALVKALEDDSPLRRAAAVEALCAGGRVEPRAALRKLLVDKSPRVRLHAALALARASDAKGVSTLIALLGELNEKQFQEAEVSLNELAGDQAPKTAYGNDQVSREKARDAWAKWWLESDGPSLLKELKNRTPSDETAAEANKLIEKLCDDSFDVRQKAEADLKKMGPAIVPLLRAALKSQDLCIRNRSQKILTVLEAESKPLSPALLRMIALRKPKGAAEAILAYVPFSEDEVALEEAHRALGALTFATGKADPAVVKALTDKVAARRAAAAVALCSGPLTDHLADLRKLIDPKTEKDAGVRLRVALALAGTGDKEAVPSLIRLIEDTPAEQSRPAEDFLLRLARGVPPKDLPEVESKRKDRAAAWRKWWDDNKKTAVMPDRPAEVRRRHLDHVLLIQWKNDQIVELDRNNKVLMAITGLKTPFDAQFVGKNRVLIAEHDGLRVTERDFKGNVLWKKTNLDFYPMQVQSLGNGDVFIVGKGKIIQVNRAGREVLTINRPNSDVRAARRLPGGQIVLITKEGEYELLDRTGKRSKAVKLPNVGDEQIEILDNGHVLVPLDGEVVEYNRDGKAVWSVKAVQPVHAVRLPNQHVLVSSSKSPSRFVEYDRAGKKVREHVTNTIALRIRTR
jgi:HEAT repeat protein